jgi:hypothetical protein
MLRLLADENLDGNILRGLRRRPVDLDAVRVQDLPIAGAGDPEVLRWSAEAGRILVTHDVQTITRFAFERVQAGLPMPGVIEIPLTAPLGVVIEDLALITECFDPGEIEGQILFLPL